MTCFLVIVAFMKINSLIEKIQLHFQHEIDAREPEWHACINLLALSLAAHVHNNIAEPKKKLCFDTAAGNSARLCFLSYF